jgi:hypothetical protein
MRLQIISDSDEKAIPINDWNALKKQIKELENLEYSEPQYF